MRFARTMRCCTVASGTRYARAISLVVSPASSRSVSATRASTREHRVAGGEDQAQEVVVERVGGLRGEVGRVRLAAQLHVAPQLLGLAPVHVGAPQAVDRAVLGGGHEPGARVVRDARLRPLLQRRHERLLREVLGEADVAHEAGEARDEPGGLDPPDGVDRALDVGGRHLLRAFDLGAQGGVPLAQLRRELVAEVLGLEHRADLDDRLGRRRRATGCA